MLSKSQLIDAASVASALSLVRIYQFGAQDFSYWCLIGGLAAAEAGKLEDMLPQSLQGMLDKVSIVTPGQIAAAAVGGLALEVSLDGLQLSDLTSLGGAERIIVGGLAAVAGMWVSGYVKSMMK